MRRVLAVLLALCALALLMLALYALAWTVYGPSLDVDPTAPAWLALGAIVGSGLSTWGAVKLWRTKRTTC